MLRTDALHDSAQVVGLPPMVPARIALIRGAQWKTLLAKRTMDIVLSASALVVLAPALLMIALLIKLESPGPVVYRQLRYGRFNRPFWLIKFRSMRNENCHRWGRPLQQTEQGDKRVTRFGRLIRATSLDELPQLINILTGDMSLVGPRPHAMEMTVQGHRYYEMFPTYWMRHLVRPGLTGLAQVSGNRGIVDSGDKAADRLALDFQYLAHLSIAEDVRILMRTACMFLKDPRAF